MENPFSSISAHPSAEHPFDGYNWDFIRLVEECAAAGDKERTLFEIDALVHRLDPSRVQSGLMRLHQFRFEQLLESAAA